MRGSKGDVPLPAMAANWPSPTTRIYKGGGQAVTRADGKSRLDMLDMLDWSAEAWSASRSSVPDPATPDGPASSPSRRSLNPLFVEWLMRWPIGWTDFGCSETVSTPWLPLMRGYVSMLCTARRQASETAQGSLL